MKIKEIKEALAEENPEALLADGFEAALIGISYRFGRDPIAIYSRERCIEILVDRDGMTEDEAWEFFEFNIIGAWMGDGTPEFCSMLRDPRSMLSPEEVEDGPKPEEFDRPDPESDEPPAE